MKKFFGFERGEEKVDGQTQSFMKVAVRGVKVEVEIDVCSYLPVLRITRGVAHIFPLYVYLELMVLTSTDLRI